MMMERIRNVYLKYKQIICYLIVGVMTTIVSLGVYFICVYTFLNPDSLFELQAANVISWIAAVTFAYFTNRKYVFESNSSDYLGEASKFFASRVGSLIIDMAIMFITVSVFHMNDKIAKLIAQVVITVANYVLSKYLVFNR